MRIKFSTGLKSIVFVQSRLAQELQLILYKLTLDFLYLFTITPFYKYTGMTLDFSISKYLISTVVFILLIRPIVSLYDKGSLSSLVLLLINLLYFLPGCTLYAFAGLSNLYFLFFSLYWLILTILERYLFIHQFKKLDYSSNKLLFYSSLLIITAGILIITGKYNGFSFHLALSDVYELRYAQSALSLPKIVNYFQPIAATLIPIALVYCLISRRYLWSLILVFLQMLSFAFGGMKLTLFLLLAALLIYFFYRQYKNQIITTGFILLNIIALTEVSIRNFSYVSGYILNRTFFMPSLLSYQYFDYFSKHEFLFWRDSILNRLGYSSPYPYQIPKLISQVYYSDPKGFANNGLCGDAYSNFGWISLLILPFLVMGFCKVMDACSRNADRRILLIAAVVLSMGFTNASFFVLLLTNGFLFALILMYILPGQSDQTVEN